MSAPLTIILALIFSHPGVWMALLVTLTAGSVGLIRKILKRGQHFDHPNERSNHRKPIVRGGGVGMLLVVLPVAGLLGTPLPLLLITGALSVAFFIDDLHHLPASLRFGLQASALLAAFATVPLLHPLSLLLPYATHLETWMVWPVGALMLVLGLWWLNLFNFMDGIDGLAATELAGIAFAAIILSAALPSMPGHVALLAGVLMASAYGFLAWNWQPARIFLGDSGSVPLALLAGYLLWQIAAAGALPAALLLPAYFLTDATGTLLLRARRGERVTEAHSAHAYQRAVRPSAKHGGAKHGAVVGRIALLNLFLLGLAIFSLKGGWCAYAAVAGGYGAAFRLWLALGGGWEALKAAPPALQAAALSTTQPAEGPTRKD